VVLPVDEVVLNRERVEVDISERADAYVYDGLRATVYPTGARTKDLIWSVEDVQFDDPELADTDYRIATVDKNGVVTIHSYGIFTVRVVTVEGNKSASCQFIAGGNNVTQIRFPANTKTEYKPGESSKIEAVIFSVDAVNKDVVWASSDESVFTVSPNGIVKALSGGKAEITATSVSNPDVSAKIELACVNKVFKADSFKTSQKEMPLSYFTFDEFLNIEFTVIDGKGYIEENKLIVNQFPVTVAAVSDKNETVTLLGCDEYDITFKDIEYFNKPEFYLRAGGTKLYLPVIYADEFRANDLVVEYLSSNTYVADVDQSGVITPKNGGEVTITAKVIGTVAAGSGASSASASGAVGKSVEFTFRVVVPITKIALNTEYTASGDKLGIAQERVFGNKFADAAGNAVDYVEIKLSAPVFDPPESFMASDFIWTTSDPSVAAFASDTENRLVFAQKAFEGKRKVTVTVEARYPLYESVPVKTSYTFTVTDGVNVYDVDNLIKFADLSEGLALHKNVVIPRARYLKPDGKLRTEGIMVDKQLYGNGHLISRELKSNDKADYDFDYISWGSVQSIIAVDKSGVVVENAQIRFGLYAGDALDKTGVNAYINFRAALRVRSKNDDDKTVTALDDISINYCIFENAYNGAFISHAETHFKGTIFRNATTGGINIYNVVGPPSRNVIAENCVFSHSNTAPVTIISEADITDADKDVTWKPEDLPALNLYPCTFEIRGFFDTYAWMTRQTFSIITIDESMAGQIGMGMTQSQAQTLVDTLVGWILESNDEYADLRYYYKNKEGNTTLYFHIGVFLGGFNTPADPKTQLKGYEQADYRLVEVALPAGLTNITNWKHNAWVLCYDKNKHDVSYNDLVDYSEDSKLYTELREGRKK
jgi:uncharacterized protein YjdB